MPKIKPLTERQRRKADRANAFRQALARGKAATGLKESEMTDIASSATFCRYKKDPSVIPIEKLWKLQNRLMWTDEEVLKVVGVRSCTGR